VTQDSLIAGLEQIAAAATDEGIAKLHRDAVEDPTQYDFLSVSLSAIEWVQLGRPRYVLGQSVAAVLVATKAATFTMEAIRAPFPSFVIEVPAEMSPWHSIHPLQILVSTSADADGMTDVIHIHAQQRGGGETGGLLWAERGMRLDERLSQVDNASIHPLVFRLVLNLLWYVTVHRECAVMESSAKRPRTVTLFRVVTPRDIIVTAEFRRYAQQLAKATKLSDVRGVLRHIVCGHWRRPPGRDRGRLQWIAPYPRGDLNLGCVVGKNVTVTKDDSR
jgi:hypothetical protein